MTVHKAQRSNSEWSSDQYDRFISFWYELYSIVANENNRRCISHGFLFLTRMPIRVLSQMKRSIQYETIFRNGSQYLDWLFHNTEGLRTHHFNYRDMLDWGRAVTSISSKLMNIVLCLHSHPTNRWNMMELQSIFEKILHMTEILSPIPNLEHMIIDLHWQDIDVYRSPQKTKKKNFQKNLQVFANRLMLLKELWLLVISMRAVSSNTLRWSNKRCMN